MKTSTLHEILSDSYVTKKLIMLSKKLLAKTASDSTDNFEMTEKMKNLEDEDFLLKARAGRKRHSVQLDKRITQQLLEAKSDRRSSNASSYGESESLCKC